MALSVGQLLGGAGQVAKGMTIQEDAVMQQRLQEMKLQDLNRQELFRQQSQAPTVEFINQQKGWVDPGNGSALYGDGIRNVPMPAPVEPAPAAVQPQQQPAGGTQQPAAPQQQGRLTYPGVAPVAPEVQQQFNQAYAPQPAQVAPYKPALVFSGSQFNWMADGPSLLKPMMNDKGQMSESAYQATRLGLMKQVDAAKQKMQAAGPLAGNEELFYYQNQLNYVDTTYNALKRQNKVVAANAPAQQQYQRPLDPRVKVEALGGYQLPESQLKRYNNLSDSMPAQLQAPGTLSLIKRAQEFGVDPAAAVSIYAIENNFGGQKTSVAGAQGSMQVMPDTYKGVKSFFTTNNQVPPALQAVAAALPNDMAKATPDQLRDAGLLFMYQLQNFNKIPTNMLGAAYHAGPNHESFKKGMVPNVFDRDAQGKPAGWTPDYNAMYIGLYNQVNQLAGGTQMLTQAPNTANRGNLPQAPAGPGQAPTQTQQQVVATQPVAPAAGLRDTVPKVDQPQVEMPPVGAFNPRQFDALTSQALNTRNYVRQMATLAAQTGNINKANELTAQLMSIDADLYKMAGDRGMAEFSRYNDPTRLVNAWSTFTGTRIQVQPRSDGKWDLYATGQLLSGKDGITKDQLIAYAKEDTDAKYVSSKAALREWTYKQGYQSQLKIGEKAAEQQGTIVINNARARDELINKTAEIIQTGQKEIAVNAAKEASSVKVAQSSDGSPVMVFYRGDGSQIGTLNYGTKQFVTAPSGEQIQVSNDIRMIQGFGRQ